MKSAEDIIIKPVITEKTNDQISLGKYTFIVRTDVTKPEIRRAIEEKFSVYVKKVNTIKYAGHKAKTKRMGVHIGKRAAFKKAIVTIATEKEQIILHPSSNKKIKDFKLSIELFDGMQ